jgi:hypothetical protein
MPCNLISAIKIYKESLRYSNKSNFLKFQHRLIMQISLTRGKYVISLTSVTFGVCIIHANIACTLKNEIHRLVTYMVTKMLFAVTILQ